jgi:hypothetical protein
VLGSAAADHAAGRSATDSSRLCSVALSVAAWAVLGHPAANNAATASPTCPIAPRRRRGARPTPLSPARLGRALTRPWAIPPTAAWGDRQAPTGPPRPGVSQLPGPKEDSGKDCRRPSAARRVCRDRLWLWLWPNGEWAKQRDQLLASFVAPSSWVPNRTLSVRVTRVWSNSAMTRASRATVTSDELHPTPMAIDHRTCGP